MEQTSVVRLVRKLVILGTLVLAAVLMQPKPAAACCDIGFCFSWADTNHWYCMMSCVGYEEPDRTVCMDGCDRLLQRDYEWCMNYCIPCQ